MLEIKKSDYKTNKEHKLKHKTELKGQEKHSLSAKDNKGFINLTCSLHNNVEQIFKLEEDSVPQPILVFGDNLIICI
jgi:hypothetical protein